MIYITILAAVIGAVVAAIMAELISLLRNKLRSRTLIRVKRIKRSKTDKDADFELALLLYENSDIQENQRDSDNNIERWLQEVQVETEQGHCELEDYFLVAKVRGRVHGFLYGHYYRERRMMFLSYMVVDWHIPDSRGLTPAEALAQYLSRELRKTLRDCEGIVFELEYPTPKSENKTRFRSKMRRFLRLAEKQGVTVKEIDIYYRQPKLSLCENDYGEERQVLMYGRTKPPPLSKTIPRTEAERVLDFIYNYIYGDYFEDDPVRNAEYRQYLNKLYETVVADLPEEIPVK